MISFRLYASTNIGLRGNNEDNFIVSPDLSQQEWKVPDNPKQDFHLGGMGSIIVVADGMGGQNAGEVASDIAIKTVQEMFAPEHLQDKVIRTDKIVQSSDNVKAWMKKVIVEADKRVREYGNKHQESEGLGSTIVMAWLLGESVYVAWMGDSRAYSFVPEKGIARLSKDHSYVQQLVDEGKLTEEEAMIHPNSNVITRSLGDTSQKAKPDVAEYDVEDGEVIMLCSDGLCGVCTDEEIGYIINENKDNLQTCTDKLTTAALANGGSDNITIAMLQVSQNKDNTGEYIHDSVKKAVKEYHTSKTIHFLSLLFGIALIAALCFGAYFLVKPKKKSAPIISLSLSKDTLEFGKTVTYTINGMDDAECLIKYDKRLLMLKGDTLRMRHNVSAVITLTAVCKADTAIHVTRTLILTKSKNNNEGNNKILPLKVESLESILKNTDINAPKKGWGY